MNYAFGGCAIVQDVLPWFGGCWSDSGFQCWVCCLQNSDYCNTMDLEPGRCRRTDGRKWRCSQNVALNQKYCERHMNRGRRGSRKHVETSELFVSRFNNKASSSDDSRTPTTYMVSPDIDNAPILGRVPLCLSLTDGGTPDVVCRSDGNRDQIIELRSSINLDDVSYACGSTDADSQNNVMTKLRDSFEGKDAVDFTKTNNRKRPAYKSNVFGFISPGFGSSHTSVFLRCGTGKISSSLGGKNDAKPEPQRCRRTDGKKWRCARDAIADQKYCEVHMHRGAKRMVMNSKSVKVPASTSAKIGDAGGVLHALPKSLDSSCINLNNVPAGPECISVSCNSPSAASDATTITDENIRTYVTEISS